MNQMDVFSSFDALENSKQLKYHKPQFDSNKPISKQKINKILLISRLRYRLLGLNIVMLRNRGITAG